MDQKTTWEPRKHLGGGPWGPQDTRARLGAQACLIRLQCIYKFLLCHAVILAFLDVLQSFYSNFISFFGTNLLTQCQLLFLLVFYIAGNQYQMESKRSETFWRIFLDQKTPSGPKKYQMGWPEEDTTRQGAPGPSGAPWWVVLPLEHPPGASSAHWMSSGP